MRKEGGLASQALKNFRHVVKKSQNLDVENFIAKLFFNLPLF